MDGLIDQWRAIQQSSLDGVEPSVKEDALRSRLAEFEECIGAMYKLKAAADAASKEGMAAIVDEFEQELQLKQVLVALLCGEPLPGPQTELNIALWKTQPFLHRLRAGA
ncbi:hypothetical protein H4R18_001783 [Coemansia javaensis]|uniref:Uncharacterized protein n=1 Tax=Coemansia javaensis TaxID=2761396 RepID=A0A9W8HH05_9FUNG|nr:hypothetical protein H4R18_001783 [Coemansia javaensis]